MSNDVNDALGVSQPSAPQGSAARPDKYAQLKSIAGIIAVFAWITGALVFIIGLIVATSARPRYGEPSGMSAIMVLLYIYLAVFIVVSLLAQAGIIRVLIDIEKNTRKS